MAIEKAGSREAAIPAWIKRFYDKAAIWWGDANRSPASLERYREYLEKFTGAGKKRILDLGGGTGQIAHCFACLGHEVVSVELSRAEYIRRRSAQVDGPGSLAVIEGNFLEAAIPGKFDVVCCWEVFGIGTDDNQKSLLKRIAGEWLAEGGTAIVEVYSPIGPIKYSGTERRLRALPGVPGSVDMVNRCSFDPVAAMWIDEWKPVAFGVTRPPISCGCSPAAACDWFMRNIMVSNSKLTAGPRLTMKRRRETRCMIAKTTMHMW